MSISSKQMECAIPVFEYLEERLLLDAAYIVTHPVNTTVTEGWKAQFAAAVAGTGPIDYQWQENDGGGWSDVIYASGAVKALPGDVSCWTPVAVMADDGALYRCVVSNAEGGETSSEAALTVISAAAASETWTGSNGDPWPAQWTWETEPGMIISPDIQDNEGRFIKGYSDPDGIVLAYINTTNAENIDQVVDFQVSANAIGFGLVARRDDANSDTYYVAHVKASSDYLKISKVVDGVMTDLDTVHPFITEREVDYTMRLFVRTDGPHTLLQAKIWLASDPEPPWQSEITDDAASLQGVSGRFGFYYDTVSNRKVYTDNYSAAMGMGSPNSIPASHIMASPEVIELGSYIHFDGSGSMEADGYVTTYDWDFGDTNYDSGVTVRHKYASAGTYTVDLTVTDNDGASHSSTKDVIVYATNAHELTIDNTEAALTGSWATSVDTLGYYEQDYAHDQNTDKGTKTARYTPNLDGVYDVYLQYTSGDDRADNVPVTIVHNGGIDSLTIDETTGGGLFNYLGTYTFAPGTGHYVEISTTDTSAYVIADAVRFVPSATTGSVILASGGVAQVPIYVPSGASLETQDAADTLEGALEDVTGGNFVQETYTTQTATGIYVGAAYELAPILPGVDETLATLNPEGVYVHARDEGLVIAGHTLHSVVDAVYTFLKDDQVGVRYYGPWEDWWVIPSTPTLSVNIELITEPWAWRRILGTGGSEKKQYYGESPAQDWQWDEWTTQNRLMGWYDGNVTHNYGSVVPQTLFAEHPEYFAWREEYGEWRASQINTSHPVVREMAIDFVIDFFDTNPDAYICSLSPKDGSGFCECTEWGCAEHTFSDNIIEFTNFVAEEVAIRRPDLAGKMIGFYAYSGVAPPPTEPHDQQDNVMAVITTGFMSGQRIYGQIENWGPEVGALGIRDYMALLEWSHMQPDFWTSPTTYLEEAMPLYEANNIIFYNTEGCKAIFPHLLNYWVTAEYLWRDHDDMDAMQDQFYSDLFGDAADAAREYWDRWNTKQEFTWRTLTLSYESMDDALAAESDPAVVNRIDDIRNYLHFLKLRLDYKDATNADLVDEALRPYAESYARFWGRLARTVGMISTRQLSDLETEAMSLITGLTMEEFRTWTSQDPTEITHADTDALWAADKAVLPTNQVDPETVEYSQDFLYLADAAPDVIPASPPTQLIDGRELPMFFKGTADDAFDFAIRDQAGDTHDFRWTLWDKTGVVDRIHTSTLGGFGTLIDSGTVTSTEGSIEHIQVTLPETGDYYLRINGMGAEVVSSTHPVSVYASRDINEIYWPSATNDWFYVPPGTNGFVVNLACTGGRTATAVIKDADGNVVFSGVTNEPQVLVPVGKDNQVWRIETSGAGLTTFKILGVPPYTSGDPNDLLVPIEALHPFVSNVEINRGSEQRSKIRTLSVEFSESVEVVKGDLTIGGVDLTSATFSYDSDTKTGTWDLTNVTLADDTYTVTLLGAGITDAQSNPLDGDRNGYGGDNYGFQFFSLAGDANGDEEVNVGDLGILAANYGSSGNWWDLPSDLNADGILNVGDLGILAASYGNILGGSGGAVLPTSGSGYTAPANETVDLLGDGVAPTSEAVSTDDPTAPVDLLTPMTILADGPTVSTQIAEETPSEDVVVDVLSDLLTNPLNV